uniref:Uncharacterized protein n=1 Tax=viral metagenome TaxID=1070528 RepID=A0A6M3IIJ2_9ZZZZ
MALNEESIKQLVKSDDFQELLKILALKIRELDTVRDIDTTKTAIENVAISQLAKKMTIETIELWLSEILNIVNFREFSNRYVEKKDDIIERLEEREDK